MTGDEPDEVSWAELGPAGILILAQACGLPDTPEDQFGLAIYCAGGGAPDTARAMLKNLVGTSYEAPLRRFIEGTTTP